MLADACFPIPAGPGTAKSGSIMDYDLLCARKAVSKEEITGNAKPEVLEVFLQREVKGKVGKGGRKKW